MGKQNGSGCLCVQGLRAGCISEIRSPFRSLGYLFDWKPRLGELLPASPARVAPAGSPLPGLLNRDSRVGSGGPGRPSVSNQRSPALWNTQSRVSFFEQWMLRYSDRFSLFPSRKLGLLRPKKAEGQCPGMTLSTSGKNHGQLSSYFYPICLLWVLSVTQQTFAETVLSFFQVLGI